MIRAVVLILSLGGLAACAGGNVGLRDLSTNGAGPDEFSVLPSNPLELPPTFAVLPPPTPGGANRTDRYPIGEGIAALGGNPSAAFAGGIPASDARLLAEARRYGVPPDIRQTVAQEDAQFRSTRRGFSAGLFGGDRYFAAYAVQALDARSETERFRRAGVPVPTVPPAR